MGNRKHAEPCAKQVVYYAPSRETIRRFVQNICDKLSAVEGADAFTQEIRSDFADFVEIVAAISVAHANRRSDEKLDNTVTEE